MLISSLEMFSSPRPTIPPDHAAWESAHSSRPGDLAPGSFPWRRVMEEVTARLVPWHPGSLRGQSVWEQDAEGTLEMAHWS